MKKIWIAGVIIAVTIMGGFQSMAWSAQKVIIGGALPITGPSANDGQMARDGAALALEHSKSRPEVQKYEIEFICEDDKSDPKDAAAIANKFAGEDKVLAMIGDYNSSCTLAAAPILTKAGIVQISPGSSSPKITGFSKYLFRTQPTDELIGANIVGWAIELKFKKAAVVYENSDFGKGLQHMYEMLWPKEGRSIVANETYLPGSTLDFSPILTKIKAAKAEAVLMGSLYQDASLMAKQARQLKLNATFFGDTSQHTNALLEIGKENVEKWHVVGAMDPESKDPMTVKFLKDFQNRYGRAPNTFAAQAYDAMRVILGGLGKSGPDREKLQTYVAGVKDFPGVTGKLTFKKGDVEKKLFRFIVEKGKFKMVAK